MIKKADNLFDLNPFLEYLHGKKYSKPTINGYYFGVKDFLDYCGKNNLDKLLINDQNISDYKNYLLAKGNSSQTINTKLYAVVKYFDHLKNTSEINIDLNIDFFKNQNKKDIINISPADFEQILNSIDDFPNKDILLKTRDELIFEMIYHAGMRTKDLLMLKKKDFDGQILNTVNGSIHIDADLSAKFKSYLGILPVNDDQFLFFSFGGRKYDFNSPLTEKSIERFFIKYTAILKKQLSIRDLRNSHFLNLKNITAEISINQIYVHETISINGSFLDYFNPPEAVEWVNSPQLAMKN